MNIYTDIFAWRLAKHLGERVFPIEFTHPFCCVVLRFPMLRSLWLQGTGVFCSKSNNIYGNGMRVTQIPSGANAPGALGQTGANTANFVRSSPQSEGSRGAQCHLLMLGPFGKVPDRVTGAIFHALVQCVAPWGVSALPKLKSHLSANYRWGIHLLIALFHESWRPTLGRPFLPDPNSGVGSIHLASPSRWSCTQMPLWAVLDPTAKPFRTQPGMLYRPLALTYSFPSFYLRLSFSHRLCHVDPLLSLLGCGTCPSSLPSLSLSISSSPPSPASLFIPFSQAPPSSSRLTDCHNSHPQLPCPLKGSGWFRQQVHAMD